MKNHLYTIIFAWLCFCSQAFAQSEPPLSLPSILSDHMVLQQSSKIKFWGWTNPRTTVRIIPSWGKDTIVVKADNTARFEAELQTPPTSKNTYQIEIKIKDRDLIIKDVLIGEVWLCSGQSNMEWNSTKGIQDVKDELPYANNSEIRFFTVEKQTSSYPQDDCHGRWIVCSSESLKLFSAVGYFFGKKLNKELNCPIGLINSSWGGTNIETWMPHETMNEHPEFTKAWQTLTTSTGWDISPSTTYNAMIHPLISTQLAGIIWYQGEANLANGNYYASMFTSMINAWRRCFSNHELPFYYVQIAPYARYKFAPRAAAQVREQQYKVSKLPNVGMIAVPDYVDNIKDIHPKYKQPVGNRLAHWALGEKYGRKTTDYRHPSFQKMKREKSEIRIWFEHAETGIVCKGKEPLTLEIAGEDMKFVPAKGKIDKKTNTLIVTSAKVKKPVAVRYSFSNEAIGNLFCTNGLPVLPFRTDNETIEIF
nr:sialate O-acetylesterase [uncultured Bacteroides sp.]